MAVVVKVPVYVSDSDRLKVRLIVWLPVCVTVRSDGDRLIVNVTDELAVKV